MSSSLLELFIFTLVISEYRNFKLGKYTFRVATAKI